MPGRDLNILLIEDDPDDIGFLREGLTETGKPFRLETITRSDRVAAWLGECVAPPDIIIMDLNLPKIHGREILKLLRSDRKLDQVPVIVLTTSSFDEDKKYCLANGADHFITKPGSPDEYTLLAHRIRRIAGRKRESQRSSAVN